MGINDDSVIDLEPYKLAYHNVKRLLKYDDMIILKGKNIRTEFIIDNC